VLLGVCWGTHWKFEKHVENWIKTHWEQIKNPLSPKGKNWTPWWILAQLIGY